MATLEDLEARVLALEAKARVTTDETLVILNRDRIKAARETFEKLEWCFENCVEVQMFSLNDLRPMLDLARLTLLCAGEESPW